MIRIGLVFLLLLPVWIYVRDLFHLMRSLSLLSFMCRYPSKFRRLVVMLAQRRRLPCNTQSDAPVHSLPRITVCNDITMTRMIRLLLRTLATYKYRLNDMRLVQATTSAYDKHMQQGITSHMSQTPPTIHNCAMYTSTYMSFFPTAKEYIHSESKKSKSFFLLLAF